MKLRKSVRARIVGPQGRCGLKAGPAARLKYLNGEEKIRSFDWVVVIENEEVLTPPRLHLLLKASDTWMKLVRV